MFDSTVTFYEAEDVAKQVDKDINVRSKDEPSDDEISAECKRCKHLKHISYYGWDCEFEFVEDCKYEPKDEPQTKRSE